MVFSFVAHLFFSISSSSFFFVGGVESAERMHSSFRRFWIGNRPFLHVACGGHVIRMYVRRSAFFFQRRKYLHVAPA